MVSSIEDIYVRIPLFVERRLLLELSINFNFVLIDLWSWKNWLLRQVNFCSGFMVRTIDGVLTGNTGEGEIISLYGCLSGIPLCVV